MCSKSVLLLGYDFVLNTQQGWCTEGSFPAEEPTPAAPFGMSPLLVKVHAFVKRIAHHTDI